MQGKAKEAELRQPVSPPAPLVDVFTGVLVAAFLVVLSPVSQVAQSSVVRLGPPGYGLLAATGLALSVRRRWPLGAYLVAVFAAATYLGLRFPGWPVYVGAAIALVAFLSSRGRAGWPFALAGGVALAAATGPPEAWQPLRMLGVFTVWLAVAVFTAEATELRRRYGDEQARHRVVEERLRIARDMHDVLSHSLATISVQSGVGLRLFQTRPEEAERALRNIRQISNDALVQARVTLATIRQPDTADVAPAPGLDDLDQLFSSVRATGLAVRSSVELGQGPVSPTVGAAVYRVVQESLTNVMRHAGPAARVAVHVVRTPDAVVAEVTDTGGRADASRGSTPGHGLKGMRERVVELGGELDAGPQPAGGFRVRARLPLGAA